MHMSSRRQEPVYSSPSRPQLYFPVFLLSLAPVGGNRLQWPHCSLSTAAHSQTHSWRLSPPAPTALPFFLSHSFSFSLVVWLWLILSLCPLPHLFSLKQFTCKISTHTVTLPLCALFSSFRLPGNTELSNCVFIGLSWIRVPGCVAKCKWAQILVYLTSYGHRNMILFDMTHTDGLSDHINRLSFIWLWPCIWYKLTFTLLSELNMLPCGDHGNHQCHACTHCFIKPHDVPFMWLFKVLVGYLFSTKHQMRSLAECLSWSLLYKLMRS